MARKKSVVFLIIYLLLLSSAGTIYTRFVWIESLKEQKEQAIKLALTAQASFQLDNLYKLKVSEEDLGTPTYMHIKKSLINFAKINDDIASAYFYTQRNGWIYFMVDSEPFNSQNYSPPGQIYQEADKATYLAMETSEPIVTRPSKDRWGTWISVLVPIKDFNTGKTVAVFGIDYQADSWRQYAFRQMIQAGMISLCIILLLITFYIIIKKNRALKKEKIKLAQLNETITEKEELFRTIFEQSPIGILFVDHKNNRLSANNIFEQIVGRSAEDLKDLDWINITHLEDVANDNKNFEAYLTGMNNGYSLEKRYIKPDSSIVWVNLTIAPLRIRNKNSSSHLCIITDISDRIQTEKELLESERNLSVILSNLPGMAYRCNNSNGTLEFVSEGCYDLTGYKPENLINCNKNFYLQIIAPEFGKSLWYERNKVLEEGNKFRGEYSILTTAGEKKWVFEQAQGIYDEKGSLIAFEGLIIDISEQKKREDEIKFLTYHDSLTGVKNRRYFEEMKNELNQEAMLPLTIIVGDINGLKFINDALGHAEGDKLIVAIANILKECCREGDVLARTGGDEFTFLLPNTEEEAAYKLIRNVGVLCERYHRMNGDETYQSSISLGCATKRWMSENINNTIKKAEEDMYRHKLLETKSLHSAIIASMKSTLYEKSQETEEHASRLIHLSNIIGVSMGLDEKQLNQLELLSTLHDIGKIGISDLILNKQDKLTDEEWEEMKKHPEIGYRIAMSTAELAPIAEYILCHHERWDGRGYPQGLKEDEIPLLSRIIAIADAFDAMTENRPYRKAMPKLAALEEIRMNAGKQFDPVIAEIFLQELSQKD
jgi:diguanylate cyclase (GGDEF)-like protein/PAS domain S-box-containing protein